MSEKESEARWWLVLRLEPFARGIACNTRKGACMGFMNLHHCHKRLTQPALRTLPFFALVSTLASQGTEAVEVVREEGNASGWKQSNENFPH